MPATLADVAKRAGVSIKTVSRVVNNEARVAEATRLKVMEAVEALGYVPNVWAQQLARGQSGWIGMLIYDATAAYTSIIVDGLLDAGDAAGYHVSIHRVNVRDARQVAEVVAMASQHRVEGYVITPPCDTSPELLDALTRMRFPFILIAPQDRCGDCAAVAPTDERGSYDGAMHLIGLGHRRIALIKGPQDHQASTERFAGYARALRESGLAMEESLIGVAGWSFEEGAACTRDLLSLPQPPTAIMASNDVVAAGVLQAAWELGLNCPQDVSIVGFDDVPLASQLCPPLTTVRQPIYELATTAMHMLIEQLIPGSPAAGQLELATELVIRHSTGPASV